MNADDAPNVPRAGDTIDGKYTLVRVLGKGGMGIVFEAKHVRLPERFAIKFLLQSNWMNQAERERFFREAQAGTRLKSEHSVRVTDMGEFVREPNTGSTPYIVMEHLQGCDLDYLVESQGVLPVTTAIDYILQACIALAEAHGKKIFHRDLKPSNLFLTNRVDGSALVKVLDFGLAKDATSSPARAPATTTGVIMLTVGYAPPEQQKGLRHAGALADIFSLGATLFYLLAGQRPFDGEDAHEIFTAVFRDPPLPMTRFRQDVPQGVLDAMYRCLEKDPSHRPQSIIEFAVSLVAYGSPEAARLADTVKRTAEAAALAFERMEEEKETIRLPPAPQPSAPQVDPTTTPMKRAAPAPPIAMAPPTVETPTVPLQRHVAIEQAPAPQKNSRTVIVGVAIVVAILSAIVAILTNQLLAPPVPNPEVTPSASIAPVPSSAPVVPVVEKSSPIPSSTTPPPVRSTPPPPRPTVTAKVKSKDKF